MSTAIGVGWLTLPPVPPALLCGEVDGPGSAGGRAAAQRGPGATAYVRKSPGNCSLRRRLTPREGDRRRPSRWRRQHCRNAHDVGPILTGCRQARSAAPCTSAARTRRRPPMWFPERSRGGQVFTVLRDEAAVPVALVLAAASTCSAVGLCAGRLPGVGRSRRLARPATRRPHHAYQCGRGRGGDVAAGVHNTEARLPAQWAAYIPQNSNERDAKAIDPNG